MLCGSTQLVHKISAKDRHCQGALVSHFVFDASLGSHFRAGSASLLHTGGCVRECGLFACGSMRGLRLSVLHRSWAKL